MPPELERRLVEVWRLQASGARDAAERQCKALLEAHPDCVDAWCTLGNVLHDVQRLDEAIQCFARALAANPDSAVALAGMGKVLIAAERIAEAERTLVRATALAPEYAQAHYDLGTAYMRRNGFRLAVQSFWRAWRLQPGVSAPVAALGWASLKTRETAQAIACFDTLLGMDPQDAEACYGLATALGLQGDAAASTVWHRRALELRPGSAYFASAWLCALQYDPNVSAHELLDAHRGWAKTFTRIGASRAHNNEPDPERPLIVGYCSRDLYAHPVGRFLEPILAHHDSSRVRAICYWDADAPDAVTARLQSLSFAWRPIAGLSDDAVAAQICEDKVDVLVDLAGHTAHHRLALFARKVAPVQVTYLGYPGTTGLDAIDYCIVDEVSAPTGCYEGFAEQLVRLSEGFCCFGGYSNAPAPARLPAANAGHVTFGSLHKVIKLNAKVVDLWSAVLRAVPNAKLLLARTELTDSVQARLEREFSRRGVAASRLIMRQTSSTGDAHLRVYEEVDIALDTVPWCGHATACDGLWMGVPMITLRGDRHAGRMTASVLTQLGLEHLIADSAEQLCEIAVALAGDLDGLAALRASLRRRFAQSSAGDGARFTPALEAAYRDMWQRWCAQARG